MDATRFIRNFIVFKEALPKTNALKPLAFSYGDTRRNAFRRANME
ncbi:hypothetical protein [Helicobacter pylori]|nr:hypothetical protein [Helicobacter pylori]